MPGLSIIIPSRNVSNLVSCLRELVSYDPGHRIIVVDDGLDRATLDCEARLEGCFEMIGGAKPFIFSRNVNLGIRAACSDDVVILNDDALLETPGGFHMLQRVAGESSEFGIIASSSNRVGNPNQWRKGLGLREDSHMVCFVAVLIPRRTIDLVGLLDERFTGYGCDDDDYCLRVRKAGLKIGIHDGCYVDHGSLTSSFRGSPDSSGDYRQNLGLFVQKWGIDLEGRPC